MLNTRVEKKEVITKPYVLENLTHVTNIRQI